MVAADVDGTDAGDIEQEQPANLRDRSVRSLTDEAIKIGIDVKKLRKTELVEQITR